MVTDHGQHGRGRATRWGGWIGRRAALALAGLMVALSAGEAAANQVTLRIEGLRSDAGLVRIGIFKASESFPSAGRVAGVEVDAKQGQVVAVIPGLEPGEYAIAIHHDEDGDGEFDTNFIGLPLEGYGFSNDAPVGFGPPDFEDAAIQVAGAETRAALRVRY